MDSGPPDTTPQFIRDAVVSLGTHDVVVHGELERALRRNAGAYAKGVVQSSDLTAAPADYRAEATASAAGSRIYSGWVIKAEPSADVVHLELDNGEPLLGEQKFIHFSQAGMTDTEIAWTMGRLAGLTPSALHIRGLVSLSDEVFVAMPVDGVVVEAEMNLGIVRITNEKSLINDVLRPLPDSDAKAAFAASPAWALAGLQAGFLFEAERHAVPRIETSIDRLGLEAQYSLACEPDGRPLPFDRSQVLTDPRVRRVALVWGRRTGRRWLRALDMEPARVEMSRRRLELPPEEIDPDPRFVAAVRAWRRSVRSTDPIEAVGALFEAIEFYAAAIQTEPMFDEATRKAVEDSLKTIELSEARRQRLTEVLGGLNSAPLLSRLRARLETDGVPFSDGEFRMLQRLRRVRNRALHGAGHAAVDSADLDLATGMVNRMLCYRASRTVSSPHVAEPG